MALLEPEQTEPVGEAADEGCRNLMLGLRRWLMDQPGKPDSKIRCYLLTLTALFGCVKVVLSAPGQGWLLDP